ncbi:MAG: hypothetical protein RL120_08710, partial [Gammaproteobacteria bacterium]
MRHLILPLAGVAAVALAVTVGISSHSRAQPAAVPLYHDLGDYHYGITTAVPLAQQYFDQGLRLYYAFNHAEAIRAFREAQRLDSDCAMCWWGEALSWGPNINLPMDTPSAEAAYAAIEQALARRTHASPREQALIDALATRYAAAAPEDRAHLDQAYADAMAKVVADFGDDHDIQVLYAEALMDLSPWDYWTGQSTPRPHIEIGLGHLEQVLTADEQHPGACHFYIHAVEEVFPERAVPCAERLARLMPGAGHLVHMPGHIYIRVGRYLDAVEANAHAVHADETYIQDQMPGMGMYTAGYYPHNYDFMAFAAMMIGRSTTAIDSAKKVTSLLPPELFGSPGMDFLQHWSVRPLHMQIRFARWQDILAQPQPQPQQSNLYALGIWHYARGRAFVGTGNFNAAEQELSQVRGLLRRPELAALKMEFNQSNNLLAIGDKVLSGWLAAGRGNYELAVAELEQAVLLEDALKYGEPPEWSIPTRQDLGSVLLKAGRPAAAENVFRQDLAKFPENGWSLHGLYQSLRDQ